MRKQELHPRTAVINKDQKNQSKKARNLALIWLAQNFPAAFDNTIRIRPLKIGIMEDILSYADKALEAGVSRSKLREAVVLFTRRIDYLTCLKAKEMRIDLQGNPVVAVNVEEAENAALKIRKRVEKSARNARKSSGGVSAPYHAKSNSSATANPEEAFPIYPSRSNTYHSSNASNQTARASAVVIKHKASKAFDPDAVARLKEKLGISIRVAEKSEVVE